MATPDPEDRLLCAVTRQRRLDPHALQTLRRATQLLSLALGTALSRLRNAGDPLQAAFARIEVLQQHLAREQEINEILVARWHSLPPHRRPHYSPELRYRIVALGSRYALSADDTAARLGIAKRTLTRWLARLDTEPNPHATRSIGALLRPTPPVRRMADVVRTLVRHMDEAGFGGSGMIARILARAGLRISKRTVARVRRERPAPPPERPFPRHPQLVATRPRHVAFADVTDLPPVLGLPATKLSLFLDANSRFPLSWQLHAHEPPAHAVARLFATAVKLHGRIRHLITDRGPQFTSHALCRALRRHHTRHRLGALGRPGSIAVIERFWRTLKALLPPPHLTPDDWRPIVDLALRWYAHHRPHLTLGGATPHEIYTGARPAHLDARSPPRGRPGQDVGPLPIAIRPLHPALPLPILIRVPPP